MSTIYLLIGIPGSGKSTWAQNTFSGVNTCTIISTDAIRAELTGDPGNQACSAEAFTLAYTRTLEAISYGRDVCFDATNCTFAVRKRVMEAVTDEFPETHFIAVTFPVSVDEAIRRQSLRSRAVPPEVITRFAQQYEPPTPAEGFTGIMTGAGVIGNMDALMTEQIVSAQSRG